MEELPTIRPEPPAAASSACWRCPLLFGHAPRIGQQAGRFITSLPNRSINHAVPVSHLLCVGLFGHTRYKVQTFFRCRRMHVMHTHSAVLFAERLDLYPHSR